MSLRVGFGYDVHRLVTGRLLILGGLTIPFEKGLDGHSDADVLIHAVMDALLGAAGEGDIGRHFPNTDPGYKGVSSLFLLDEVGRILTREGLSVGNIDAVIAAEKPTLAGYLPSMEKKIAGILAISNKQVNVKATTTEGLGFTGTGEGIAAWAITHLVELKDG
ncbi:MAG: 2-C-methyl-D-erythritol 2,4-cyclodiphosphate synthase [Desulfotomaculum sp. 46_296]|nr:MAG: 2-C-methyl-D-erythritol 2,4-cyclodiphosphate synthase [Desulfotomaculum sp. 46_296]KUK84394.1 MAG: 2-C-methyl-D-erythritol 2,4-cyclodiphosphate synthase [Desulfofundulus kuznetsovii]HAU31400.1 2-C-methyl-D-erythritol 2,4-cyclodiphosphate synthase [Desulfotomaculum sp.]